MARRLPPFIAVIPLGVVVGLLAASQDWSTSTRILITAASGSFIVLVGTPFAMGHLGQVPPATGRGVAPSELVGVYYEDPFTPRALPEGLFSGPRSADLTVLLPLVLDRSAVHRERVFDRVLVVPARHRAGYYAGLNEVPYNLALWPERRTTAIHRFLRRMRTGIVSRRLREIEVPPKKKRAFPPPPPVADRLIDSTASPISVVI